MLFPVCAFMDAKKFLFVSHDGLAQDLAWHIAREDNEVRFFIEENSEKEVGDGFVEKVTVLGKVATLK